MIPETEEANTQLLVLELKVDNMCTNLGPIPISFYLKNQTELSLLQFKKEKAQGQRLMLTQNLAVYAPSMPTINGNMDHIFQQTQDITLIWTKCWYSATI